jgi:hypothetical protein
MSINPTNIRDILMRDISEMDKADPSHERAILVNYDDLYSLVTCILKKEIGETPALATAGVELAEYASYAEIVGGVSHNRGAIRKWCDTIFEINRRIQDCELDRIISGDNSQLPEETEA